MALSANILEKLPQELVSSIQGGTFSSPPRHSSESTQEVGLATGFAPLDQRLPDAGLLKGCVVELTVSGASALATSIGLMACGSAQQAAKRLGGSMPWCAFIDPSRSLYAPGVAQLGVDLEHLLVVRPQLEALGRVTLRMVESQCFAVVVIDTVGMPGAELAVPLGNWPRIVRRLAMALQGSTSCVLLITDAGARRPLTLPVAQRIELSRPSAHKLILQVAKDKRGRISKAQPVALSPCSTEPASSKLKSQEQLSPATWVGLQQQAVNDVC